MSNQKPTDLTFEAFSPELMSRMQRARVNVQIQASGTLFSFSKACDAMLAASYPEVNITKRPTENELAWLRRDLATTMQALTDAMLEILAIAEEAPQRRATYVVALSSPSATSNSTQPSAP